MKTLKLLSLALGVLILPGALLAHHGERLLDPASVQDRSDLGEV